MREETKTEDSTWLNSVGNNSPVSDYYVSSPDTTIGDEAPPVYYYKYNEEMTLESVQGLIDIIHMHPIVVIKFSSLGGDIAAYALLRDYLNSRIDEVYVVFDGLLFSAGFLLLLDLECSYCFEEQLFEAAMIHKVDSVLPNQRLEVGLKYRIKYLKKMNKRLYSYLKSIGLSNKKLKRFEKGKDVYLYKKDLKKLNLWKETLE